ncbi:hypothetical protein F4679DRAFT_562428 [Xylaria curta]|nr:hypothetical protein F4679DRAFT_562428 [Xylaria curta]
MRCFPVVKKLFKAADSNPALRGELLSDRLRAGDAGLYAHQSVAVAVRNSDSYMLRYLLNQKGIEAHLNHVNAGGYGVLHIAAVHAELDGFKLLVPRLKVQVNMTNKQGNTALNVLIHSHPRAVGCVKVLLTEGEADVSGHHEEEGDNTKYHHALHQALRGGAKEMCHVLAEHGNADLRDALDVYDGEASLLDFVTLPGDNKELAREILAMLSSLAGIKPSSEVGPRKKNMNE